MPVFALKIDASGVRKGSQEAVASLQNVSTAAQDTGKAIGQVHANNSLDKLSKSASSASTNIKSQMWSIAAAVGGVAAAYKSLEVAQNFLKSGVRYNAEWEQSKIGIASVIASVNQLQDEQGKMLTGAEKYTGALQLASGAMERIKIMGLETTATTAQLVEGFQALIGPAAAVGMTMQQTEKFTLDMVQALGAMGIPLNQLSAEARSLLDGTIVPTQDRLAVALGITGEMVKTWKQQGVLVEELGNRLSMFALAGKDVANTWGGLTSNMQDAFDYVSGISGKGLFEGAKESMVQINKTLVDIQNMKAGSGIINLTNKLEELNNFMGKKLLQTTNSFIGKIEVLNRPENLQILEDRFTALWQTGETAFEAAGKLVDITSAVGGRVVDSWMKLPEPVREYGLIAALLGGKKVSLAIAAATEAYTLLEQFSNYTNRMHEAMQDGTLSFEQITSTHIRQFDALLAQSEKLKNSTTFWDQRISTINAEIQAAQQQYTKLDAMNREAGGNDAISIQMGAAAQVVEQLNAQLETATAKYRDMLAISQDATGFVALEISERQLISQVQTLEDEYNNLVALSRETGDFGGVLGMQAFAAANKLEMLNQELTETRKRMDALRGGVPSEHEGVTPATPTPVPPTIVTKPKPSVVDTKGASAAASALKSLTSELAKLQLTDAQYQQWQTSQKIADLEKSLGKANPKVKELQALLQNDLEAKFLQSIQEYADPATAQLAKLQKEYQKVLDTVGGSKSLNNAQKNLFNTQAAKQYEKALEGVFLPPVPCTMPRPSASPSRWHPSGPQTKSCWPAFPAAGRI